MEELLRSDRKGCSENCKEAIEEPSTKEWKMALPEEEKRSCKGGEGVYWSCRGC